jgi:hypothetical protein
MFTLEFWYTALLALMLGGSALFGVYVLYRLFKD